MSTELKKTVPTMAGSVVRLTQYCGPVDANPDGDRRCVQVTMPGTEPFAGLNKSQALTLAAELVRWANGEADMEY